MDCVDIRCCITQGRALDALLWRFRMICRLEWLRLVNLSCSWLAPVVWLHYLTHWPLARYAQLRVAHAPGMPGTFSPPPRVSDPDMHHGTCVTHVPWCMPGSLTNSFLRNQWWRKRSQHSQRMRNPQFYVSGKRPFADQGTLDYCRWSPIPIYNVCRLLTCCLWTLIYSRWRGWFLNRTEGMWCNMIGPSSIWDRSIYSINGRIIDDSEGEWNFSVIYYIYICIYK